MPEIARPLNHLNDALMKFIFASEERKHMTLGLINAVFAGQGTKPLADFMFIDRELDPEHYLEKESQLDVLGRCQDGTTVNVEVQVSRILEMPERSLFYWARLYRLNRGQEYASLRRTVCINILDFRLFNAASTPDFHNCFGLLNRRYPGHCLSGNLEIHFLELPVWEKQRRAAADFTMLDNWLAYLSPESTPQLLQEVAMQAPIIQEALAAEREFLADPDLVTAYDLAEKARMDRNGRERYLQYVREQSFQQGIEEGIEQGIEQGIEKKSLAVAARMLSENMPLELISKITDLPVASIEALRKGN